MVTDVRRHPETNAVPLGKKRQIIVRQADETVSADVTKFFQKYSIEEKTLANRNSSEIEKWIRNEEVLIVQSNDVCIGIARVVKLDTMYGSVDPIVYDFRLGSVRPMHSGLYTKDSGLTLWNDNNIRKSIPVDRSASVYVSSLCIHRPFRKTIITSMLIDQIMTSIRQALCVNYKKFQTELDQFSGNATGILFGTAVQDQTVWKLACKSMQREVNLVFGHGFTAKYLTFRTSYPDGSAARGNFVYFQPCI